jgi:hypothetical protein
MCPTDNREDSVRDLLDQLPYERKLLGGRVEAEDIGSESLQIIQAVCIDETASQKLSSRWIEEVKRWQASVPPSMKEAMEIGATVDVDEDSGSTLRKSLMYPWVGEGSARENVASVTPRGAHLDEEILTGLPAALEGFFPGLESRGGSDMRRRRDSRMNR